MAGSKLLVYLLRRDLRIADNPIFWHLSTTQHEYSHLLPIFVIPPHQIEVSGFLADGETSPYPQARSNVGNFWRCGPHRAKFLAQSVWDLKTSLEEIGSGLVVRVGSFADVIKGIIESLEGSDDTLGGVWMTEEKSTEEKQDQDAIFEVCAANRIDFVLWPDEKYFVDDRDVVLAKPEDLPLVFTEYLKLYKSLRVLPRPSVPRPRPGLLPSFPYTSWLPQQEKPFIEAANYEELVFRLLKPIQNMLPNPTSWPPNAKSNHTLEGGETQAWERVSHLAEANIMAEYAYSRNGLIGLDYSTKLSGYLALGCITARQIHEELVKFEDSLAPQYHMPYGYKDGDTDGTRAIRLELLWRDYMRLSTIKWGRKMFDLKGIRPSQYKKNWNTADKLKANPSQYPPPERIQEMIDRFLEGRTGMGLIDASQRELYHTGYTSNRARQNVASFFSRYLSIDWRYGAEWYEAMLVDYDVSSNWGNWQYAAGIGNDPRSEGRVLNPVKQGFDYDNNGEFTRMWVPEVKDIVLLEHVFQVWTTGREELQRCNLVGDIMVDDPLIRIKFNPDRAPRPPNKPFPWWMQRGRRRGGNGYRGSNRGGNSGQNRGHRSCSDSRDGDGVSIRSTSNPRSTQGEIQSGNEQFNNVHEAIRTHDHRTSDDAGTGAWTSGPRDRGNSRHHGRGAAWDTTVRGRGGRVGGHRRPPPQASHQNGSNLGAGPVASTVEPRIPHPNPIPPPPPPGPQSIRSTPPVSRFSFPQQPHAGPMVPQLGSRGAFSPVISHFAQMRLHGSPSPVPTSVLANAPNSSMPPPRHTGPPPHHARPAPDANTQQFPPVSRTGPVIPSSTSHSAASVPYAPRQYPPPAPQYSSNTGQAHPTIQSTPLHPQFYQPNEYLHHRYIQYGQNSHMGHRV